MNIKQSISQQQLHQILKAMNQIPSNSFDIHEIIIYCDFVLSATLSKKDKKPDSDYKHDCEHDVMRHPSNKHLTIH